MIMRNWRAVRKVFVVFVVISAAVVLGGCNGANAKTYDISPIFPLSSGVCAKYGGVQQGSGVSVTCMVTKGECEKAAADWGRAMTASAVNDAVEFSCN